MAAAFNYSRGLKEMLLDLLNEENNTNYKSTDILIHDEVERLPSGRNRVKIEALDPSDDIDIPFAHITFNPIPLEEVFSLCGLNLHEWMIVDENNDIQTEKIHSEILRRYGFKSGDNLFTITRDGYLGELSANSDNLVYTGSYDMSIHASLKSRVLNTKLRGMHAKPLLEDYIDESITLDAFDMPEPGIDIPQITWHYDWTVLRDYCVIEGGKLKYLDDLNDVLELYGVPKIPATATPVLRKTNASLYDNTKFDKVLVVHGETAKLTYHIHFNED
tara:strand:+ start:2942 stop:3766 length:825 start_codon:yes stop_codon:yes gene_type:complete